MRKGRLYQPPKPDRVISASGSSSSPGALLRTPGANLGSNGGPQHPDKRLAGGHQPSLEEQVVFLLPTTAAHDSGNTPANHLSKKPGRMRVTSLKIITENGLIPTGGRIPQPSADGSASPADPPQPQLSLGWEPGDG
jgi:hypothetical protein